MYGMIKGATTRLKEVVVVGVPFFGGLMILTYGALVLGPKQADLNPLNWAAREEEMKQLSRVVFELSDTNRDGLLSWTEVGEMYRRAGFDIDSGNGRRGRFSGGVGIGVPPLGEEGLKKIIDSYR